MKKLLTAAAAAIAACALAIGLLSLPWRGSREGPPRLLSACRTDGPLTAGAAERPIPLAGTPSIAGFAKVRWAAEGLRDPVSVRALVAGGPGCAVGLVSAEVLLVPEALRDAVAARVKDLGLQELVLGATHTHAGPGGYWDSFLGGRAATGPWDPRAFEALAGAMAEALRAAAADRRPALLSAGEAQVPELVFSRAFEGVDGRLVSVRFLGADGATIGELAVLGAHPTLLGMRNRRISGDWPGALMRSRRTPTLFFQGALGDQTTQTPDREEGAVEAYGRLVAVRLELVPRSSPAAAPPFALARAAVPLPPVEPGALPRWLRPAARTLAGGMMPGEAEVSALRLGPLLLLAVPAEPVAALGARWRAAAGPGAEILSLANGYAGYVEEPEVMARGGGETPRTYYGPLLGERLEAAVRLAAGATRRERARAP